MAGAPAGGTELGCRRCGCGIPLHGPAQGRLDAAVSRCAICGDDKFYIQKEFNQKVGCLVVGVGALFVPWTYGLSLAACALLDWALYRMLPWITVCYICGARYAGLPLDPGHKAFDLMTAQTWEARALTWRRRNDQSPD